MGVADETRVNERQQPLRLIFEAHNAERNHHRAYEVEVGQDLLGEWTVTVRYGRDRASGRARIYRVADLDAARRLVRDKLKRRLSAPRRLGCPYRLTRALTGAGEELDAWVPRELLAPEDCQSGTPAHEGTGRSRTSG
jgi:predicted DNA-binding WGR domain protein